MHRKLARAIGWDDGHADDDLDALDDAADNLNLRHSLAQHAERASAELYTLVYFQAARDSNLYF